LTLINKGQDKLKQKVAAKKSNVPVSDEEAKALSEVVIQREIDLVHAEFADHAGKKDAKPMNPTLKSVINAVKKPVAAAPLLVVIFILIGIKIPASWTPTFDLIAKANAGVAVLAAGLILSTVKFSIDKEVIWNTFFRLFLTPGIIVLVSYLCGMCTQKISMLCLATGLPPAFSGIIISSRYNIYVKEGASSVAVSTVFCAVSCIFWIWILPIFAGVFH
jgi:predicted permease